MERSPRSAVYRDSRLEISLGCSFAAGGEGRSPGRSDWKFALQLQNATATAQPFLLMRHTWQVWLRNPRARPASAGRRSNTRVAPNPGARIPCRPDGSNLPPYPPVDTVETPPLQAGRATGPDRKLVRYYAYFYIFISKILYRCSSVMNMIMINMKLLDFFSTMQRSCYLILIPRSICHVVFYLQNIIY